VLKKKFPIGMARWDHKPLDLLTDDLTFQAFTLTNLIARWESREVIRVYFLLPFVCANLAVRNRWLSLKTRLDLLQTAFSLFFAMSCGDLTTEKKQESLTEPQQAPTRGRDGPEPCADEGRIFSSGWIGLCGTGVKRAEKTSGWLEIRCLDVHSCSRQ
jgi:hypothetical protein